jgi:hypothetical protein
MDETSRKVAGNRMTQKSSITIEDKDKGRNLDARCNFRNGMIERQAKPCERESDKNIRERAIKVANIRLVPSDNDGVQRT